MLNLLHLYLAHVQASRIAPVVGFATAVMTLSKALLYWLQGYFCGGCAVGHNSTKDLLLLWVIPNGLWIIVPSMIVYTFGKDIARSVTVASKLEEKQKKR
ncbi:hypothetical protein PENSPDRAFT_682873 [Peniophora sp. CONT]|nr:hypothetical protein PENSPDRAFT_682873 [Peniophora sp. CONT]